MNNNTLAPGGQPWIASIQGLHDCRLPGVSFIMNNPLTVQAVMVDELTKARTEIAVLQSDNLILLHTLQSATAWIRSAGGDCVTLDQIIREQLNIRNAHLRGPV